MTDIATTSPIERIARVICAEAHHDEAKGGAAIAAAVSGQIDAEWSEEIDRARAVLRTLREPSPAMVEAGNAAGGDAAAIWSAMVRAAIEEDARPSR